MKTFSCFEFKEFTLFSISSSGVTCGIRLRIAEILFVSFPSESFSLGCSAPGVSSFPVCLCASLFFV